MNRQAIGIVLAAGWGFAQSRETPPNPRHTFDVASIRLNPDCREGREDEKLSPGRISVSCITARNVIQAAYGRFASGTTLRIFGAPDWLASNRYDIAASAEGNPPMLEMFGPMLQVLLEDRLKLKVHRESRELPVYTLMVAKGGLKLRRSKEGSCTPIDLNHANDPSPNFCGMKTRTDGPRVTDDASGMSMSDIAGRFLSNRLDRPVIDKTGIQGVFDAHLEFDRGNAAVGPAADTIGPSIYTAVQEQLGLKLTPGKGPVEVLVIDHVEKPSEN